MEIPSLPSITCHHGVDLVGLTPKQSSKPSKLKYEHYKSVEFLSNFQNVKHPCTNVKPPNCTLSDDGFEQVVNLMTFAPFFIKNYLTFISFSSVS